MSKSILKKIRYIDDDEVDEFIEELIKAKNSNSIGFLNQHGYNLMMENSSAYDSFMALDYLLRDGIGIKIACKMRSLDAKGNLNGTDLIPKIVQRILTSCRPSKFFVYGTQEPWLTKGTNTLFSGRDVETLDGFQHSDCYRKHFSQKYDVNALNVVILAMGMPKQELIAHVLKEVSSCPVLIICGGAIIDFQAGKTKRAPEIFRKANLEWLYRLFKEPKRMFKRYIIGIPKFFYYLLAR
ncbi:WecB/TagA/CpsF family glycosyltransferase [Vibrio variabilis]|uniref:WecB/TagA/CpsF family glycosyltransferase n=1 Tax=Vibrio variabilis TaxID=990271 RepID=UPI000690F299|nr:WecB/TagA/CpsF family glycosyltransferase [Vibrio variabilis]